MALRECLREAERKSFGEEPLRIGRRCVQCMILRHACTFFRSFPWRHTPDPPVRCYLTTARDPPSASQPHYDIPQMTEEEPAHEFMRSGRSYHRIVESLFFGRH